MRTIRRRRYKPLAVIALILLVTAAGGLALFALRQLLPQKMYTAEDFGIETLISPNDKNGNGVDDYTDLLLGARLDAENMPRYRSAYYAGGYPPDDEGVCTDLVWRAFEYAGYNLKEMVDADIAANVDAYPRVEGKPDPNIDFRRVPNLYVFFSRNAQSLTTDLSDIAAWQPGDIVIFGDAYKHIGIISDKRNRKGIPWLIHNGGQPRREEDVLEWYEMQMGISGHFRFTGERLVCGPVPSGNGIMYKFILIFIHTETPPVARGRFLSR